MLGEFIKNHQPLCVFDDWEDIYSQFIFWDSFFAPNGRNFLRNTSTCPKIAGNQAKSHEINKNNMCTC
jgi:hypothetical protein